MKRCSKCGEEKSLDAFPPIRRGEPKLQSWCRDCFAAYGRDYYKKNREAQKSRLLRNGKARREENCRRMIEFLLAHPCVDCGEEDIVVLECDHLRDKEFDMAELLTGGSTWGRIERELEKCETRCANCHRRKTASRSRTSFRRDYTTLVPKGERLVEQLHLTDGSLRRCRICELAKPLFSFPFRSKAKRTRQWICLDCQRDYSRRWYVSRSPGAKSVAGYGSYRRERLQARIVDYLRTHPCVDCGENDVIVLDFDHLGDKVDSVLNLVASGQTWVAVSEEISKCEVRCANCHRRRTARQVGAYRLRRWDTSWTKLATPGRLERPA